MRGSPSLVRLVRAQLPGTCSPSPANAGFRSSHRRRYWRTPFLTASGGGLDLQQLLRFRVEESDSEIGMNPAILFAALFPWVHPSQNRTIRSLREPTRQFFDHPFTSKITPDSLAWKLTRHYSVALPDLLRRSPAHERTFVGAEDYAWEVHYRSGNVDDLACAFRLEALG